MRVVAETEVYSTPTRLEFWGGGSGGETGETGGWTRETGVDFSSFQGVPILDINTEIFWLAKDLF